MPPLSGSDEWNENDISNFDLSNSKKPKLSDSSLHRVTPDSGIALHYQSSVSSVGSLSPSIEKASSGGEDSTGTNTITSNGKGFPPQGFEEVTEGEKRSRHMSELRSDVAGMSLKKPSNGDISPYGSPTPNKGTIPLSHAPPMDVRAHQQPLMHVNNAQIQQQGVSPGGLIHSSSSMVHSPAHNSAFPFNPSAQMGHHPFNHSTTHPAMYHHPSAYPMGAASRTHNSLFPHTMSATPSPFASHPVRSAPPYDSLPSVYQPHSSLQHSPYRQSQHLYSPQQPMHQQQQHRSTTGGYPSPVPDLINGSINRNDPSTPGFSSHGDSSIEMLTTTTTTSPNDDLPPLSMEMNMTNTASTGSETTPSNYQQQNDIEEGEEDVQQQEIKQQSEVDEDKITEEQDDEDKELSGKPVKASSSSNDKQQPSTSHNKRYT